MTCAVPGGCSICIDTDEGLCSIKEGCQRDKNGLKELVPTKTCFTLFNQGVKEIVAWSFWIFFSVGLRQKRSWISHSQITDQNFWVSGL